ncbi:hypothetical protein MKX07_006405 [Trichoderma sp. CBMAI-0711]|uniref:GRF-type domain-containing protein n=1 Tax=Trichoderma parareesei TaxID=858221 RepID=A0A2H3ABQ7_TRIPA|nr:hypothetical protein MKX07_006405 [Trichoderma sp. CBMAI-0711]OTA08424.1 hypothetical protein A9Z42_0001070 [Trichoderma parareesei]
MATPSSNRYQNAYPGTPSSEKRRLKGLWYRNEWWCNCSPRARAVARSVTSNTTNKGKGFWVCRLPPNEGCGFFLFFEEARLREISLSGEAPDAATPSKAGPSLTQTRLTDNGFQVLGRRRSDPGLSQTEDGVYGGDDDGAEGVGRETVMSSSQPEAGSSAGRDKGKGKAVDAGDGGYEPLTPGTSGGLKRKFDDAFDDDDDELDSDDERQLAAMTDRSVEKFLREHAYNIHGAPPDCEEEMLASSSKPVARTLFPHAQNSAAAGVEEDILGTSSKPVARTLFPQAQGRTAKRTKTVSFEEPEPFPPTPSRASNVRGSQSSQGESSSQTSPRSSMENLPTFPSSIMTATQLNEDDDHGGSHDDDVTEKVMGLLQTQSVEPSVLESVRKLLVTSARRTKGIAMGRDSARAAVKEKNTKIARLHERIAALEDKERVLNSQITHIKASLMKMYEDN